MNFKLLSRNLKDIVEEITLAGHDRNRIRSKRFLNSAWQLEMSTVLHDGEIGLVIDVGANEGQFAQSIRDLGYKKQLISFEPDKEVFQILQEKSKQDPLWQVVNLALGAEDKKLFFNVYRDSKLSSFREGDGSNSTRFINSFDEHRKVEMYVKRLDAVWGEVQKSDGGEKMILKLDTQGYDIEAFKGIGDLKKRVKYILTELSVIPIYKDLSGYTEALQFYESEGYGPVALIPVTRNHGDGRVIEFDCLLTERK